MASFMFLQMRRPLLLAAVLTETEQGRGEERSSTTRGCTAALSSLRGLLLLQTFEVPFGFGGWAAVGARTGGKLASTLRPAQVTSVLT